MKTRIIFLTFIFIFNAIQFTDAQVGNYLKKKAESATNRAGRQADKEVTKDLNKAVDKGVANAFDKVRKDEEEEEGQEDQPSDASQPSKSSSQSSGSKSGKSSANDAMTKAMMGRMGISMERPANIKDSYNYTSNLVMNTQSWDSEGNTEGEMPYTTHYRNDGKGFAMEFKSEEKGNSRIIFDYENEMMIILADDGKDKSGVVMKWTGAYTDSLTTVSTQPTTTTAETPEVKDYTNYYSSFKKTGSTKSISGYKCEEYEYNSEEDKATFWMTNDLPAELWANMFSANVVASVYAGRPNGFIMEWTNENKTTKEKSHMIVKEVNRDKSTNLSTAGYTFMSFGGPQSKQQDNK